MIEFISRVIEDMGRSEGGIVKDVCDVIVESWANWDIEPYASMVRSELLEELPNNSTALHVAFDLISIMKENNPREHVSEWVELISDALTHELFMKHADQNFVSVLWNNRKLLDVASINTIPDEPAFTRKEYFKLLTR